MKLSNFKQFIKNFGQGRYIKLGIFFAMSLIAGCLEFIGIALIYPFIMMIINPDIVTNSTYYNKYVQITGIDNIIFTAFAIGFFVLLTFIIKNIYIIINTFIQSKFVANWKKDLTKRFMEYFIYASDSQDRRIENDTEDHGKKKLDLLHIVGAPGNQ